MNWSRPALVLNPNSELERASVGQGVASVKRSLTSRIGGGTAGLILFGFAKKKEGHSGFRR